MQRSIGDKTFFINRVLKIIFITAFLFLYHFHVHGRGQKLEDYIDLDGLKNSGDDWQVIYQKINVKVYKIGD